MPQFLSPEWMEAAHAIREKHSDQAASAAHKIRMNLIITSVPFDQGEVRIYMDTTDGPTKLEPGQLDSPDVTVTTDYDTARKIIVDQDPQAGMQAFMAGKVKVQGDMTKLMMMQGTAPDATTAAMADELKQITD